MAKQSSLTNLSLQPEEPHGADDRASESDRRHGLFIALLVLLAMGLGVGSYIVLKRMQALQQQVAQQTARADEAAAQARQAAERAGAAEAAAQRSAEGRQTAETQMDEARHDADASRQEADASRAQADVARQEASSAKETAARAQAEADEIRKKAQEEIDRLHAALGTIAETRQTALGLVMRLGGDHLKFEFDKAELQPEDRELLSRIAGILMTATDTTISVNGYTDDVGTEAYNQALSLRRAEAVRDYLVKAGLPAGILSVNGKGKSFPLVPGTSDAARAKNRRVELGIASARLIYHGAPLPQP
jgi:outer membrane protein OmpA-like peptidoglycan-associated protein